MKVTSYQFPKSSFLSAEKDMSLIVNMIMRNDNLKKLLHYTTKDCLNRPILTEDESIALFGNEIKIIPKLYIDRSVLTYIIVSFDNYTPNLKNPEFRDNIIEFDIICHFDQWQLKDFQLRPYRIAAEIDSMFNGAKLSGIGKLDFAGAAHIPISDTKAGFALLYVAIHGDEDQKDMLSEQANAQFIEEFNRIWNSDDE